jgi:hypothetical protein
MKCLFCGSFCFYLNLLSLLFFLFSFPSLSSIPLLPLLFLFLLLLSFLLFVPLFLFLLFPPTSWFPVYLLCNLYVLTLGVRGIGTHMFDGYLFTC